MTVSLASASATAGARDSTANLVEILRTGEGSAAKPTITEHSRAPGKEGL